MLLAIFRNLSEMAEDGKATQYSGRRDDRGKRDATAVLTIRRTNRCPAKN
jgi:hypothetical protein